jgi:predicted small secreted protein
MRDISAAIALLALLALSVCANNTVGGMVKEAPDHDGI